VNKDDLQKRTKAFAIRVFKFLKKLPSGKDAEVISFQLFKASSSVAANYRAACRGRSAPDFLYKLRIVDEEADESLFWLEFLDELELHKDSIELNNLKREAQELVSIFSASIRTLKRKKNESLTTKAKNS